MIRLRTALLLALLCACHRPAPPTAEPGLDVAALLGNAPAEGFARADAPRTFSFPGDHGPHPGFRSEWWYFTGVLAVDAGTSGRRVGYQLTIFRQALAPEVPPRSSPFATRDVYMAHFALADLDGAGTGRPRFAAFERFARAAAGLAGSRVEPFGVWVEDWSMAPAGSAAAQGTSPFPLRLAARARHADGAPFAIDLIVDAGKGPVLQGDRGLSVKGPEPGNASYYYSMVRLPTRGHVSLGTEGSLAVSGTSWLDREWSTSALGPGVEGWDWLAVHLDDGRELMLYRLRRKDGGMAPESRATLIARDGTTTVLAPPAFTVRPLATWTSPHTGARYPAGLEVSIPSLSFDLRATPLLADQELPVSVRYWEGAVAASGSAAGTKVTGTGYLELTGYERRSAGRDR